MEEDANRYLRDAIASLINYNQETTCSWCIGKSKQMIAMLRELEKVGPQAKELSKSIDLLQAGNVQGAMRELRQLSGSPEPARARAAVPIPLPEIQPLAAPAPAEPEEPPAPFTGKFQPRVFGGIGEGRSGMRLFNREEESRLRPLKRLRERRQED